MNGSFSNILCSSGLSKGRIHYIYKKDPDHILYMRLSRQRSVLCECFLFAFIVFLYTFHELSISQTGALSSDLHTPIHRASLTTQYITNWCSVLRLTYTHTQSQSDTYFHNLLCLLPSVQKPQVGQLFCLEIILKQKHQ